MAEPQATEKGRADGDAERAGGPATAAAARSGPWRANPEREVAGEEEGAGEYGHGRRAALALRPSMAAVSLSRLPEEEADIMTTAGLPRAGQNRKRFVSHRATPLLLFSTCAATSVRGIGRRPVSIVVP